MALSKLSGLYQMVIRDHADHPHHAGELTQGCVIDMNNPTCGDVIRLSLELEDDKIKDIAFSGHGCTISTASASMMTEAVIGRPVEEVESLAEDFSKLVTGEEISDEAKDKLGEAQYLAGVAKFPQRVKCSTLAWNALKKAIEVGNGEAEVSAVHE